MARKKYTKITSIRVADWKVLINSSLQATYIKRKHSAGKWFESLAALGKKLLTKTSLKHQPMVTEKWPIRITSGE